MKYYMILINSVSYISLTFFPALPKSNVSARKLEQDDDYVR